MEEDREDDIIIWVTLDEETSARYDRRAEAGGRTLEKQILYELKVRYGLTVPDPGDVEATQHGQLFRRMVQGHILQG